jgi:glucosamine--fructose-6-phosphate aminotransferase (isomerizing)
MCGVIGFISEVHRDDLGLVAAELLKTLEYRGYDSTGAAVQDEGDSIVLRKGVGAPSVMVERLGIVGLAGSIMCGQVRWATFGSVDDLNAQPHEVRCKIHIYGAHNGNVTNCDDLKAWLTSEGHDVVSDNDGEMVVHTIEHEFAAALSQDRKAAMREAIVKASKRLKGSFAAVVVDPVSRTLWAIKQGSSLYFGIGRDEIGGGFAIASSDLSSVLKLTRVLVPMSEGDFVEYTPESYRMYKVATGERIDRAPTRSRLQAKDAALLPRFRSYMEQEIDAQEETCRRIDALFRGGSDAARELPATDESIDNALLRLREEVDDARIRARFRELVALPAWRSLLERGGHAAALDSDLHSQESSLLADLIDAAANDDERKSVHLLDALIEREEVAEFSAALERFLAACRAALSGGGRVFFVCCGSSYHAALAGAVFFNELAHAEIVPVLPGEFRGRFAASLRPQDVVVAVSQSGETKDLIDVMNHVIATGLPIRRIGIVNNVSSTLGQEKCDTVLPLRCGPEIAVPATKSYINQLAMMYGLAARLGGVEGRLHELPRLIRATLDTTAGDVERAARLLYLEPSMHILATRLLAIAKEGALKIREVVLNHTEGFEASEFKHGPNTILGVNTIFGIDAVLRYAETRDLGSLYSDYPLIFVTGPDATDVNLTISQINTHKIRGATCVLVAEENAALRQAITKPPADNPAYQSVVIALPETGDNLATVFTATVVLQRLALRMSELKQEYLDGLGFPDHGVHPDVPKNVSKSITVD